MNKKIRKSIEENNDLDSCDINNNNKNKKIKKDDDDKLDSLIIKTPIGGLKIIANNKFIFSLKLYQSKDIDKEIKSKENINVIKNNLILNQIKNEIELYFKGELKEFKAEINPVLGTEFQRKIWNQLKNVPYGSTTSYADIAIQSGLEKKYARAVATCCFSNIFLLVVPCHRIVSSSNKVIGYCGKNVDKQYILSNIEKSFNK